jgi:sporulation protein YlmC with PRC-barrel domain
MRTEVVLVILTTAAASGILPLMLSAQETAPAHEGTPGLEQTGAANALQSADTTKSIRVSQLMGVNITSSDGANLGQVQDLVINPKSGKIEFALVGKGFMAGEGETIFPVPWMAVNVSSQRQFVLKLDKNKLSAAPGWNPTEVDQPDYVFRVYRFYELEPETGLGTPGVGEEQTGQGQGKSGTSQPKEGNPGEPQKPDQQP